MNILICDDIKSESTKLASLLDNSGHHMNIAIFHCGYDVLDYVQTGAVIDVCFLDIIMPEMNGVILAEELRARGFNGEIVFLTTTNEYAAESYSVGAFSYLLKPLKPDDVHSVLSKLDDDRKKRDVDGILIKISKIARFLLFRDISHVEVIKHYVYFLLTDGEEIEIYATFGEIADKLLIDSRFAQCHRSYIVNMSHISVIDAREITMRNGNKIPISNSYPDVKRKFTKWIIGVEKQ